MLTVCLLVQHVPPVRSRLASLRLLLGCQTRTGMGQLLCRSCTGFVAAHANPACCSPASCPFVPCAAGCTLHQSQLNKIDALIDKAEIQGGCSFVLIILKEHF